jgi:hypothetical protein
MNARGIERIHLKAMAAVVVLLVGLFTTAGLPHEGTYALFHDPGTSGGNTFAAAEDFGLACEQASDAFGYTCKVISYAWEDIAATGACVELDDDEEVSSWITLGFNFQFYGVVQKNVVVAADGLLAFAEVREGDLNGSGQAIPDPAAPNHLIAGYWEDLDPDGDDDGDDDGDGAESGTCKVTWELRGSSPERRFIVQWTDVPHAEEDDDRLDLRAPRNPSGPGPADDEEDFPVTFQVVLHEGTHRIVVNYEDAPSDGGIHTAGIEDADGAVGLRYDHGDFSVKERSVEFAPPAA